ncbi:MAG: threonylcarbamoyl-AMP synthase [Verrucomicrobiaceae bacterium]|nr:threonylcarbamoyl-AMP synthase [Verrucomicrobiaceae bacterium]
METVILEAGSPEQIRSAVTQAASSLRRGELVALPTETVYGLAACASNPEACAAVFEAKERPGFDPLIVHVSGKEMLETVADIPAETAEAVHRLISEFWPGPLTFVLPKTSAVPDIVTAGLDTVAVRCSNHPVFKAVIKEVGAPLAAPSANRFGSISPTSSSAVMTELSGRIPLIIDSGACSDGMESTIVRVEASGKPKPFIHLLRPGPVTVEMLKKIGKVITGKLLPPGEKPEAPGQLSTHYAPQTSLQLLTKPADFKPVAGRRYAMLSYRGQPKDGYIDLHPWHKVEILSPGSGKLPEAAVRFFFALRKLDECGADTIIAEPVPERGVGLAIQDRLRRAAASH